MLPPLLGPIFASAGLGALIGLIRQWSEQTEHSADFGGVRTHTFWAILGCIAAVASRDFTPLALPVVIVVVSAHLMVAYLRQAKVTAPGSTSFAASLLTLFVGALVAWDHTQTAVVVAALTMVLLGLKQPIHDWTRAFTPADIRGTLQFVAITGVILPLVPNRDMGPFDAFNPFSTWLMVVLISGLGFCGYIAMRLLGARAGIFVTSLLGGLASSTALTLAFSRRSRSDPARSADYAFGVAVASTVMLPRVIIVVGIINPELAFALLTPFILTALPAVGFGLWVWGRKSKESRIDTAEVTNPLSLGTAIKFALLYAAITLLVTAATKLDWQAGLLPLSFVSGLTDTVAISLSVASGMKGGEIDLKLAAQAVIVAAIANSLLKAGLAASLGSPQLRRQVAIVLGLTSLAGVATLFIV